MPIRIPLRYRTTFVTVAALAAATSGLPAHAQRFGAGDHFADADANGDGTITREEFAAARARSFDKLDRNGDGIVQKGDFGRLARFKPDAAQRLQRMIDAADANRDGKVTRDEFVAAPSPVFDRADTDGDGVLSKAEADAARSALAAARNR
ncbi:EF-hand domain-containing protein [Sphingomonas zeicaulis]|uniref:EF-hand domain-containing protein n=1 Tax=Sphingomonas zeicaulis TaxID=1632740 RepID=UPI003D2572DE